MTVPDLGEFAENRKRPKGRALWWTLPEEVREQVVATPCSTAVAVEWLREKGYSWATFGSIDPHRRQERRRRGL
jgi:hypothetical protein